MAMGVDDVMNTQEYLGQISKLDKMIERKLCEVNRLDQQIHSIAGVPEGEKVQKSPDLDKLCTGVSKLIDFERETEAEVEECINKRKAIIAQIDAIPSKAYYVVLTDRYVREKTFDEIASEMGCTKRHALRLHSEALEEFGKCIL
jgi:DNA-directed RNA polymerase specialized sigma subunit